MNIPLWHYECIYSTALSANGSIHCLPFYKLLQNTGKPICSKNGQRLMSHIYYIYYVYLFKCLKFRIETSIVMMTYIGVLY